MSLSLRTEDYERFAEAREWMGHDYDGGSVYISVPEVFTTNLEFVFGQSEVVAASLVGASGNYGSFSLC